MALYDLANAYKDEIMASRAVSRRPHFCRYSKSDLIHDEAKLFEKHKKTLEYLMQHMVDLSTLDPQPDLILEYLLACKEKRNTLNSLLRTLERWEEGERSDAIHDKENDVRARIRFFTNLRDKTSDSALSCFIKAKELRRSLIPLVSSSSSGRITKLFDRSQLNQIIVHLDEAISKYHYFIKLPFPIAASNLAKEKALRKSFFNEMVKVYREKSRIFGLLAIQPSYEPDQVFDFNNAGIEALKCALKLLEKIDE